MRSVLKPGFTSDKLHKLRSISPAAVMITTDKAICPITSSIDTRNCPALPATLRLPECSDSRRFGDAMRSAGISPNKTPVTTDAPAANRNTGQCSDTSLIRGVSAGSSVTSACNPAAAASSPTSPATAPSTTLSESSCRTSLDPVAPSALRTAISRSRPAARASIRFATFAHAISRISPTAPNSSISRGRISPTSASSSGTTVISRAQSSGIRHGKSGSSCGCRRRSSPCACTASHAWLQPAKGAQVEVLPGPRSRRHP